MAAVATGPPKLHRVVSAVVRFLIALVLALVVIEQWVVWIYLGVLAGGVWGVGVATVILAAQILVLFDQPKSQTCRPDDKGRRPWNLR